MCLDGCDVFRLLLGYLHSSVLFPLAADAGPIANALEHCHAGVLALGEVWLPCSAASRDSVNTEKAGPFRQTLLGRMIARSIRTDRIKSL